MTIQESILAILDSMHHLAVASASELGVAEDMVFVTRAGSRVQIHDEVIFLIIFFCRTQVSLSGADS
jgi:hypothetical protein